MNKQYIIEIDWDTGYETLNLGAEAHGHNKELKKNRSALHLSKNVCCKNNINIESNVKVLFFHIFVVIRG